MQVDRRGPVIVDVIWLDQSLMQLTRRNAIVFAGGLIGVVVAVGVSYLLMDLVRQYLSTSIVDFLYVILALSAVSVLMPYGSKLAARLHDRFYTS